MENASGNNVLVVDDVLAKYETFDQIEEFKKDLPEINIHYFASGE